ncbi:MAG: hypothetical protein H8E34_10470 [Bacteroidetes bacterium]|nr:hypothetical protein [Bacteroidota bacterium]
MSIGIDYHIDILTTAFNADLFTDIVGNTYTAYGRAYINEHEGQKKPEVQTASSTEYVDVMIDTAVDGISFCVVDNKINALSQLDYMATVNVYFAVNLDILYPTVTERATEYLHRDVGQSLNDSNFEIISITTGLEAFADFDFIKESDNLEPFYLAKFECQLEYQLKENINC